MAKGQETLLENLVVALGSLEEGQRGAEWGLYVRGPLREPRPGSMWLPACIPPPGAFQKLGLLAGAGLCGWGTGEASVPNGHSVLNAGDRVIVFAQTEVVQEVMDMFAGN